MPAKHVGGGLLETDASERLLELVLGLVAALLVLLGLRLHLGEDHVRVPSGARVAVREGEGAYLVVVSRVFTLCGRVVPVGSSARVGSSPRPRKCAARGRWRAHLSLSIHSMNWKSWMYMKSESSMMPSSLSLLR